MTSMVAFYDRRQFSDTIDRVKTILMVNNSPLADDDYELAIYTGLAEYLYQKYAYSPRSLAIQDILSKWLPPDFMNQQGELRQNVDALVNYIKQLFDEAYLSVYATCNELLSRGHVQLLEMSDMYFAFPPDPNSVAIVIEFSPVDDEPFNGRSAFNIAKALGFKGNVYDWLDTIVGDNGQGVQSWNRLAPSIS